MAKQDQEIKQQRLTNVEVSVRLNHLEDEVASIRNEISCMATQHRKPTDLSQIFLPVFLSFTSVPITSIPSSNSARAAIDPHQPHNSLFGFPEQYSLTNDDPTRLYSTTSMDRLENVVPEFNGKHDVVHPERFLRQLNIHFGQVSLSPIQQLVGIQQRLTGDALEWYETMSPLPETYDDFRIRFRQYFWSTITQRKIRNEFYRPYQYHSPVGIESHARSWILKVRYISPPIEQDDMVDIIIQHYPYNLSLALRGRGPTTTHALLTILKELEESPSFCHGPGQNNSNQSHDPRPRHVNDRRGGPNHNYRGGHRGGQNHDSLLTSQHISPAGVSGHQDMGSGNGPTPRP